MNQNARQKRESSIERDLYRLMNTSNFGTDFRNNTENCKFEPIYDKIGEISLIKKYETIFGNEKYKLLVSKQCVKKSNKHLMKKSFPEIPTIVNLKLEDVRYIEKEQKMLTHSNL